MIIFLEKVREKTLFSFFEPIVTEPLELIYLQTVLSKEGIKSFIIDDVFKLKAPEGIFPELIILNGYNVAENLIIKKATSYKARYPHTKIMVSGVHAQINRDSFRVENIDFVFFSQSLETFRSFIRNDNIKKGIDIFNSETNTWILGEEDILTHSEDIIPDREFFNEFKEKTRYVDKKEVAIVKASHGCPYNCSFCYCRLLNKGIYIRPNYDKLVSQVKNIDSNHIWIIDDTFFITREDAVSFIDNVKKYSLNKSIIAYLRADFIVNNEDIMYELKKSGLDEVIVGFESPDVDMLINYNKEQNANIYKKVVELLNKENIELTALFIVDPNYTINDFQRLYTYIRKLNIHVYTLSIMTPLKGTQDYEKKKHLLTNDDQVKYDFLHLVLPSKLPKWLFYALFHLGHLRLLRSKRIWKMIRGGYEK